MRCHTEDNCERGRKNRQRITTGIVDRDASKRTTVGILVC